MYLFVYLGTPCRDGNTPRIAYLLCKYARPSRCIETSLIELLLGVAITASEYLAEEETLNRIKETINPAAKKPRFFREPQRSRQHDFDKFMVNYGYVTQHNNRNV